MPEQTSWESIKADSNALFEKLRQIVHEGNVRRVRVRQGGTIVAEFPLTAGVVGVVLAPVVAAIATLVALLKDCTLEVERVATTEEPARRTGT